MASRPARRTPDERDYEADNRDEAALQRDLAMRDRLYAADLRSKDAWRLCGPG